MTELQLWVSVAELGCFFGLIALGYYLVLAGAGFFNFAIGTLAMLCGLSTSWMVIEKDMSLWPAIAVAVAGTAALSAFMELAIVRPVQRRSGSADLPALVAVAGILFAIQQLAGYLFGRTTLPGQRLVSFDPIELGQAVIQPTSLLLVVVTLVSFVLVGIWVKTARSGRLLRAVGDSKQAAAILGLPVNKVRLTAFVLSGLVAAVAGLLFAPKAGVSSMSGLDWALSGFLALVVGGAGSVWAPLIGGLIIGALQIFVPYYFGGPALSYVLLAVAIVFFAFRPQGIFVNRVRT